MLDLIVILQVHWLIIGLYIFQSAKLLDIGIRYRIYLYCELDVEIRMSLLNLLVQLCQGMDDFFIIYYNLMLTEYLKEVHVCLEVSLIYKDLIIKLKILFKL